MVASSGREWRRPQLPGDTDRLRAVWLGTRDAGKGGGELELAVSREGGRRWSFQELPTQLNSGHDLLLDDDGALHWMGDSEAACGGGGQSRFVGNVDGRAWQAEPWPLDAPMDWALGAQGWAYALSNCAGDSRPHLCAVSRADRAQVVRWPVLPRGDGSDLGFSVATNGRVTFAVGVNPGELVRPDGARATLVARNAPARIRLVGVDADGRPIGIDSDGGALRRFSGRSWAPLLVR